jgi:hypothetical protein
LIAEFRVSSAMVVVVKRIACCKWRFEVLISLNLQSKCLDFWSGLIGDA